MEWKGLCAFKDEMISNRCQTRMNRWRGEPSSISTTSSMFNLQISFKESSLTGATHQLILSLSHPFTQLI